LQAHGVIGVAGIDPMFSGKAILQNCTVLDTLMPSGKRSVPFVA